MNPLVLAYDGFDPPDEGLREALCTLGNGYMATRGAAPEADADAVHYPGTYVAGVYNRLVSRVAGRQVENEDLVNVPNWLPLTVRPQGGRWLDLGAQELLAYRQELDLRRGVLTRRLRVRDPDGRVTGLTQRRFVSRVDPHLAGLETTVGPRTGRGRWRSARPWTAAWSTPGSSATGPWTAATWRRSRPARPPTTWCGSR
jgi:trehalose/maltose hydrolase-like predicted phosphorylase